MYPRNSHTPRLSMYGPQASVVRYLYWYELYAHVNGCVNTSRI